MIIDTTCSVVERKMKETPDRSPTFTFNVDKFVKWDMTVTGSSPAVFTCEVVYVGGNSISNTDTGININTSINTNTFDFYIQDYDSM